MKKRVILEVRVPRTLGLENSFSMISDETKITGFQIDTKYKPVPATPRPELAMTLEASNEEIVLVRGTVEENQEKKLKENPKVIAVWTDAKIEPFSKPSNLELSEEMAPSPCSPYDCDSSVPKGDLTKVAQYLGADWVWGKGIKGNGIVIGICDTGVRQSDVSALIGGWSPPGGSPWGDNNAGFHGTMCATDALCACPEAKIFDIGILKSQGGVAGLLSDAIAAYAWALTEYQTTGKPQILSNSWGIYQKNWAPDYANDPNHPFTRKVVEVIDSGMLVCYAAGNCGEVCPSGKCGSNNGPNKSIWGANGHPKVITVGAANIKEEWIGYSSQGPASLDPKKPDFCAPSHFKGYTNCDNGTSAACPVAAGVLGLLLNAKPGLKQDVAKAALQKTAHDICASGWDQNSGYGIINAKAAYLYINPENKVKTVDKYAVLHYRDGTTRINIYFDDGSWDYYIKLDSERASLLLDILRNEKPVFWTEGLDILWSGREPVGENER